MQPAFEILFEDADFLAVSKPAGLLTQAPLGIDSLEFQIKRMLSERTGGKAEVYLGVPHRLDRPVSGAIVFAKALPAARRISKQFETRRVEKTYWAAVEGHVSPSEGTWTDNLKKVEGEPRSIVAEAGDPSGQLAVLHYRVLQRLEARAPDGAGDAGVAPSGLPIGGSLCEMTLETGRTHQIRVQCASRGHVVIGDEMYGSQRSFGPISSNYRERLIALHARRLRVWQHMVRGYITVEARLPDYWKELGVKEEELVMNSGVQQV
jgi:23S rRNA pseudouridine1911/1915/1917 synthase